jgi:hypothetical protein
MPSLQVEGTQFYIGFANIVQTSSVPLLDKDWLPFNEFERFRLAGDEEIFDHELLLGIAEKIGPLFGAYDDDGVLITESEIREPASCWFAAARLLNFAIRAHAYLSGRSDDVNLDDEVYYLFHTGRDESNCWECVKFFADELSSPYLDMLSLSEEKQKRLLLPATDTGTPRHTFLSRWDAASPQHHGCPHLFVHVIPDDMDEHTAPVGFATHRFMTTRDGGDESTARALLAHMVRSLVLLHTHRIYRDLHDGYFGVAYNNLLERLWYNFATDAAIGKLGVCEHCGRVFEAMAERKDRKRFCSTDCQEYAKSARNYRKRKIREAIERECSHDVLYLLHVLDDPKITREMIEAVLLENLDP